MKWEMETEEIEAVLEKIWDLHDKISDAIHSITRNHFLSSIKIFKSEILFAQQDKPHLHHHREQRGQPQQQEQSNGFVFTKDSCDATVMDSLAEARSLNSIRTALENLEDQFEFFHTVQSQQQVERDAAIARLEQTRLVLAMRLADHHGNKYKVIEEALAFVGDVHASDHFVAPENLFEMPRSLMGENLKALEGKKSSILMQALVSSFTFAKKSLKFEQMAGVLGNVALFAVGMLALLQIHHKTFKGNFVLESSRIQENSFYNRGNMVASHLGNSSLRSNDNHVKNLEVLSARG